MNERSAALSQPPAASARVRRILVADDDAAVRTSLAANLEVEGYQVVEASDGAEAVARIEEQAFDLILSDVVMPVITGVEVLSDLRKRGLNTPFILFSAFVSESLLARAVDDGLFAMLYKPFAMERILEVVTRALRGDAVLLVDDNQSYVGSLAAALQAVGLRVEACPDGASAIEFAKSHGVDVCVLDVAMEPLDGLATCDELQRLEPSMDIIAITGHTNIEQVRGMRRRGVTTCLRKPFEVRELLTAIARVHAAPRGSR